MPRRRFGLSGEPPIFTPPPGYTPGVGQAPPDVLLRNTISPPISLVQTAATVGVDPKTQQYYARPPWIDPPLGSFPVSIPVNRNPTSIPAGGSVTFTWPQIPQGKLGVVRRMGSQTSDSTNTRITTRINGIPVAPYTQLIGTIGTPSALEEIPSPIIVPAGQTFDVLVENLSAAAITAVVISQGWWY